MTRLLSAALLIVILALPVILGPAWIFFVIAQIVVLIALYEFYHVSLGKQALSLGWIGWIGAIPLMWFCYYSRFEFIFYTLFTAAAIIITAGLYLFEKEKACAKDVMYAVAGMVYPAGILSFWFLVRNGIDGKFWMILGLMCTFASDAGAYYVGKNLGKHRIAQRLSPKKTFEGLLGGMCASLIIAPLFRLLYSALSNLWPGIFAPIAGYYPLWLFVVLGSLIAVLDLIGDLTASMFKREFNVKDMGNLIPGHGGMLDRMDGIVPVGLALYLIILMIR